MANKKYVVQVPTNVVRNEDIFLNNGEFLLYARLCFLYFRNYKDEEIRLDHRKFMCNLNISDTRTLKKRLNKLYECELIRNKIDKFPKQTETVIMINSDRINGCKHFTQLNTKVFTYQEKINEHAFRLLFYYKSHINMDDKERDRSFCFVGVRTLKQRLKMSSDTIKEANDMLKKNKLIKIEKHKLKTDYEYDEMDELIFDRYNHHYKLNDELF